MLLQFYFRPLKGRISGIFRRFSRHSKMLLAVLARGEGWLIEQVTSLLPANEHKHNDVGVIRSMA